MSDSGFELVMPFLPVQSKGGPYDDEAYTAGWEMGLLDYRLSLPISFHSSVITVRANNRTQADLIAMRHGYTTEICGEAEGWVSLSLKREAKP